MLCFGGNLCEIKKKLEEFRNEEAKEEGQADVCVCERGGGKKREGKTA